MLSVIRLPKTRTKPERFGLWDDATRTFRIIDEDQDFVYGAKETEERLEQLQKDSDYVTGLCKDLCEKLIKAEYSEAEIRTLLKGLYKAVDVIKVYDEVSALVYQAKQFC